MAEPARTIDPAILPEPLIQGAGRRSVDHRQPLRAGLEADDEGLVDALPRRRWPAPACSSRAIAYTVWKGIGVWGNNIPVAWAFGIINFVWWIGIGHAGTLISAILLLFQQKWRTSINRFAEAMTLFAVMCAGLFPVIHTGRPWFAAYWLFPYPSTLGIWPQFRSPLMWDVFAVSTYFTTSLLFWYLGLLPDLASLRDRSTAQAGAAGLRHLLARLARRRPSLARLHERLLPARRPRDAAGALGPHHRVLRLRHVAAARLAHDDLPALLRRRRRLLRLRDGGDADRARRASSSASSTSSRCGTSRT